LSYPRSCQKGEKIWEDFENLAEPDFSGVILYDTLIFYPKPQKLVFHCKIGATKSIGGFRILLKFKSQNITTFTKLWTFVFSLYKVVDWGLASL
jgi:hypothetical protein